MSTLAFEDVPPGDSTKYNRRCAPDLQKYSWDRGRWICKAWECSDVRLSHGWRVGYGVVEAVVEVDDAAPDGEEDAVVEASVVGADALASTTIVRVLVALKKGTSKLVAKKAANDRCEVFLKESDQTSTEHGISCIGRR